MKQPTGIQAVIAVIVGVLILILWAMLGLHLLMDSTTLFERSIGFLSLLALALWLIEIIIQGALKGQ